MAELTPQGFKSRTLEDIINEISGNLKATFGNSFDTTPESADGQIIGIFADQIYKAESAAQAVYQSSDPDSASDVPLEYVCDYNGIYRRLETSTIVVVKFSGVDGTVVPKGTIVATQADLEFSTDEDSVVGRPTSVTCLVAGAIIVAPNQITQIKTPVAGVSGVTNEADGITGTNRESDAQLRNRRAFSVINSGTNTVESIYSGLYESGASFVNIVNNTSNVVVDNVPPNEYMVIVEGLSDTEVAETIFVNAPPGVSTHGNVLVAVKDSRGNSHNIHFARPTNVSIDVRVTYKPLDGASNDTKQHIQQAVEDYIRQLHIGSDVIWSDTFGAAIHGAHFQVTNASVKSCVIKRSTDSTYAQEDIILLPYQKARVGTVEVTEV